MSTFGIRCGLAEYARELNRELQNLGVEVEIWANIPSGKNVQDKKVLDDENFNVERNWSVEGWSGEIQRPVIGAVAPPLVHIQYESFLYAMSWFPGVLRELTDKGAKIVVTYHTAGVPQQFPGSLVDTAICHTDEIFASVPGRSRQLFELPGPYRRPRIGTFGLGRAHVEWIEKACDELGYEFVNMIHVHGEWQPLDELIDGLRTCDVLALPYPPVGTSVSSSAAKVALATMRPLVVSDTNWFSNLPDGMVFKHKWEYDHFKAALQRALPSHEFVRARSWAYAAARHKCWYEELLNT